LNSILVAIISVGIIASLFVAVQLLFRVGSNRYAAMWLGFFMVTLAFLNGMFLLVETGRILDFWFLYRYPAPLNYIVPAMVLFYLRAIMENDEGPRLWDWVHAVPFIAMTLNYIPYFTLSSDEKKEIVRGVVEDYTTYVQGQEGFIPEEWAIAFRVLLTLAYIPAFYHILRRNRAKFDLTNRYDKNLFRWLRSFTTAFSIYIISVAVFLSVYLVPPSIASSDGFQTFMGILFIFTTFFWTGSLLFYAFYQVIHPAVGIGYITLGPKDTSVISDRSQETGTPQNNSPSAEPLPQATSVPEPKEVTLLLQMFKDGHIWKEPDFSMSRLAAETGLSPRKVSFILNRHLGGNFNTVTNHYRIQYAKELIEEGFLDEFTLDALKDKCGYRNRVSFYNAFKRETGMTPSEYKVSLEK
jgi:AraC-like DNA-binding protein